MVILDVEASGTDNRIHSIVSIGAVDFDNPTRQLYDECRIWDGAHVMDEALEVCGFTKEEVADPSKKSEAELYDGFIEFALNTEDHTLAGQNPSFDRDYLHAAALRAGKDWPLAHRTIDTHSLAWMHMVTRGMTPPTAHHRSALNLDTILNYVGIPEEPKPHNALTGALCHAEVISRLLYDKKLLPDFEHYEIPWLS
jgi:DNA polymerase III epsilon subunit-like protein